MVYEDHYNSRETQEAWIKLERAESWLSGNSVEYGHTKTGDPFVRLDYGRIRGKSMWFPLYDAAQKWSEMRKKALDEYNELYVKARDADEDGPQGR